MPQMPHPSEEISPLPVRVPLVTQPMGVLASLRAARTNLLSIIPDIATRQPMVSGRTGKRWHMVMDPGALKRMLLEKLDNYPKSDVTKNMLRPAIGESLFIAEGAHWRWQRRATAPAFSHRNVSNLAPVMSDAAIRTVERVGAHTGHAVNLYDEMVATTFDVISEVTFSQDQGIDRSAVHDAIEQYIVEAGKVSLFDIFGLPDWIPRPGRMVSGQAMKATKSLADRAIEARSKRQSDGVPDLLDLLLAGEDPETGRRMNTAEMRDNLLTFIVAGHETTALALSWSLYLCAFDPAVQDEARQEARNVLGSRSRFDAEDLPKLGLIRRIVDEALRLYPPAALVSRTAREADELCGREIRPGDTVMVPIYALHRHHQLWVDPDAFRPDRWARGKVDRYAYLPFGDGPRICIGASFALQEAVLILATLLSRFRFTAIKGRDPDPVMILTLRPEGGVWLECEPL